MSPCSSFPSRCMRPSSKWVCAALLAGAASLLPVSATAQDPDLNLFQYERSYAGVGTPGVLGAPAYYFASPEPDLLAEAQLVTHLALRRGWDRQEMLNGNTRLRSSGELNRATGFNIFLVPQFRLRGLSVESGPVRSISFMPKFVVQYLAGLGEPEDPEYGIRRILGTHFTVGHHSNGGDGCEFADEFYVEGVCTPGVPDGTPANQRQIRLESGNFSTNYLEFGLSHRLGRIADDPVPTHWAWAWDVSATLQFHHEGDLPLPGGARPAFADLYGRWRGKLDLGFDRFIPMGTTQSGEVRGGTLRLWSQLTLFNPALERFPGSRNYTLESEAYLHLSNIGPGWLPDVMGVGLRYSRGMDYYNRLFVRDINHLQFAIYLDPWTPFLDGR